MLASTIGCLTRAGGCGECVGASIGSAFSTAIARAADRTPSLGGTSPDTAARTVLPI